jgi:hypothetical protein
MISDRPGVLEALRSHEPEPQFVGGRWDCSCGWHAENSDAQMWWDHIAALLAAPPAALDVFTVAKVLARLDPDHALAPGEITWLTAERFAAAYAEGEQE